MEPQEFLARARAQFEQRLRAVTPGDLDRPTPCPDWTVAVLIKHVILGDRMAIDLLDGGSREAVLAAVFAGRVGADLLGEFDRSATQLAAAFAEPGAAERIVHHPSGDVPGRALLGFRAGDYTYHAWDLARATGQDETLDDSVVAAIWATASARHERMVASGMFGDGPSGQLTDDAPLQLRLLDLSGRRP